MRKNLSAFCMALALTSAAAAHITSPPISVRPQSTQVAVWKPKLSEDNELFPSFVLATNGRKIVASDQHALGDPIGLAGALIRASVPNAQARVVVQIDAFSAPSEINVALPEMGQLYQVMPVIKYDFRRLAALNQPVPANVTIAVSVNGIDLGQQTLPIRVRSVNDVPFLSPGPDGTPVDLSVLFAAYVDESNPLLEKILQQALSYRAVDTFVGYHGGRDAVRMQVFALWNVLQRNHMDYTSITAPSVSSPSGQGQSQAVRFIDQGMNSQQANSVDGSVLFASLLYKIGIDPVLVHRAGHMFVGYYLDEKHSGMEFLETTMIRPEHQPRESRGFGALYPAQDSESWKEFIEAVQFAEKTFATETLPALQQHLPGYSIVDIALARKAGIKALRRGSR